MCFLSGLDHTGSAANKHFCRVAQNGAGDTWIFVVHNENPTDIYCYARCLEW